MDYANERFLPAKQVLARYGVVDMTLDRWVKDARMGFPKPVYFGRLRFWKLSELVAFEQDAARKSMASRNA